LPSFLKASGSVAFVATENGGRKMNDLARQVASREGVHLAVVFRLALEYGEARFHPRRVHELYNEYLVSDKAPRCVNDFALDVLAGRITIRRARVRRAK
jgi:hypothetical protein